MRLITVVEMKGNPMSQGWLDEYIYLALHVNKLVAARTTTPFLEMYCPHVWREAVQAEPAQEPVKLLKIVAKLVRELPLQGFEERRELILGTELLAIETVCRLLDGEVFQLEDMVERCLGLRPSWIPESQFEEALELYREALPGKGTLARRLYEWRVEHQLASKEIHRLPDLITPLVAEARRRTREHIVLPEEEGVDMEMVKEKSYKGACWYQGNYRSRIDINIEMPPRLNTLMNIVCHETYPGHHTEAVLKEQSWYREKGYIERSLILVLCPQLVISEGLAMLAQEMIFEPGEVVWWMEKHVYSVLGMSVNVVDYEKLRRAELLLEGVEGNLAFMFHRGYPEDDMLDYQIRYLAPGALEFVKDPFTRIYDFSYYYGDRLLRPLLQGADRWQLFRRLLAEPMIPADLM